MQSVFPSLECVLGSGFLVETGEDRHGCTDGSTGHSLWQEGSNQKGGHTGVTAGEGREWSNRERHTALELVAFLLGAGKPRKGQNNARRNERVKSWSGQ